MNEFFKESIEEVKRQKN